jgi:hypothetical protein
MRSFINKIKTWTYYGVKCVEKLFSWNGVLNEVRNAVVAWIEFAVHGADWKPGAGVLVAVLVAVLVRVLAALAGDSSELNLKLRRQVEQEV